MLSGAAKATMGSGCFVSIVDANAVNFGAGLLDRMRQAGLDVALAVQNWFLLSDLVIPDSSELI